MVLLPTPARAATASIVSAPYPTRPSSSSAASRITRRDRSTRGSCSVSTISLFWPGSFILAGLLHSGRAPSFWPGIGADRNQCQVESHHIGDDLLVAAARRA